MKGRPIAKSKTSRIALGGVSNVDRISNLPAQVLELILSDLPIRDIVRTSILSSNWRYKWATAPNLVFDVSCRSAIVDHVLLLHTGPIEIFKIKGVRAVPDTDRWVFHVCRRSIKELVLEFHRFKKYKVHSCLSKCESLVKLKLSNCLLSLPTCFEGFKSLKCLCLEDVTLEEDALEKLISSCPLLEELTFIDPEEVYDNLKIDARNLRCLDIRSGFHYITFGRPMDMLVIFSFAQFSYIGIDLETSLPEILTNLPSIQRFVLKMDSLSSFGSGFAPESMPIQCKYMYYLSIYIDFGVLEECLTTLYLFRCSPNLTELEIEASDGCASEIDFWVDNSKCNWEFRKLRWVKMVIGDISDSAGELECIQFLLASSPVLEKMTLIAYCKDANCEDVMKRICGFKRASADAKIILNGRCI